ncbi:MULTISPECIES: DUF4194 domain-containing protein [Micrococcaceae]|uniref:DUF4194 domain-containing protein n=1 Tax=Glutamicibacter protophormiae TaxID=37930 RepID=A0ABS4XMX8_GLUPR|nr:DUF4194 domain-containing protein [Glutamicibacter protophormiae]MBP2397844.1 hypothetical protein [Glutamicibacter protophormiae]GGL86166.1 hypothetical protein GCM10010038_15150 [Glutamicibacter protophormiae]
MTELPAAPSEMAEDDTANRDASLWSGDSGELAAGSRRVLVQLVKGPYLSAERHPEAWKVLLTDTAALRSRLADLFLDLVLDESLGVAFVRNAPQGETEAPQVVRTMPLTFMDSALLLFLRRELLRGSGATRVFIGRDEVYDHLNSYRAADTTDEAGFRKRVDSAWTKMLKHSLLVRTDTEDRVEISPILRLVFSTEQIQAVQDEYQRLAGHARVIAHMEPDETEEQE